MKFTLEQLKRKAVHRPQGYYQDVMALANEITPSVYELDDKAFAEIARRYRLPSKMQMIANITNAVALAIKNGADYRDANEVKRVLSICIQCPFYIDQEHPRCGDCGCFLGGLNQDGSIKFGKTLLKNWKCGRGKWDQAAPVG